MVLSTPFTCPNGHSFVANAKLRTRCPDCGAMARRTFDSKKDDPPSPPETPEEPPVPKKKEPETPEPKPEVKVLRRGRPSSIPEKPTKKMPKKTAVPVIAKKKGIITHKSVKKAVVPIVRGRPKGNREHKIAGVVGEDKSFQDQVVEKYGLF